MPKPPFGYKPRPASDPHRGKPFNLSSRRLGELLEAGTIELTPLPQRTYQYRAGSCTGQSLAGALRYVMNAAEKQNILGFEPFQPSALAIYAAERILGRNFDSDDGAHLSDGIQCLKMQGIPRESAWPYDERRLYERPPASVWEAGGVRKLANSRPLIHDVDEIRHALALDCPVVLGVPCYSTFFSSYAYDTGYVGEPGSGDAISGWHAVWIYKHDPVEHRFYFRNSWEDWGPDGCGSMSDDYVTRRANEIWAVGAVR